MNTLGTLAIIAALACAAPALAGDTAAIGEQTGGTGPTVVQLRPSSKPGSLGELTLRNEMVNDDSHTGARVVLDIPGLTVEVTSRWNADLLGADAVNLDVPEGVICLPSCELMVPEGETGTVTLYSVEGIGA